MQYCAYIVKGKATTKRNLIIKTDTVNTFCEKQAVFTIFYYAFSPVGHPVYYIMLFHVPKCLYKYCTQQQWNWIVTKYRGKKTPYNVYRKFSPTNINKIYFFRVRETKKSDYWLRLVCISVRPSVGLHVTISGTTGWISLQYNMAQALIMLDN